MIESSRKQKEILTHTDGTGVNEADVYQCLIHHLKFLLDLGKGRHQFNYLLLNMFGCDGLRDLPFLYFLSSQLSTNYSNFKRPIDTWLDGGMMFKRGKYVLALEVRQAIYDTYIDHSVASADNRSNRTSVQISKKIYIQRYNGIDIKTVQLEKSKNKLG